LVTLPRSDQSKLEGKSPMSISAKNIYQRNATKPESPSRKLRPSFRNRTLEKEGEEHTNPIKKETEFG
jgi:hypothetical protein